MPLEVAKPQQYSGTLSVVNSGTSGNLANGTATLPSGSLESNTSGQEWYTGTTPEWQAGGQTTYTNPYSGGGTGYAVNNTPVAPPAPVYTDQWGNVRGSQADVNRVNSIGQGLGTSQNNLRSTNAANWTNTQTDYNTRADSLYNNSMDTQSTINTNRANNALNLRRSMAAIANGVRQGLRSGGVNLANMNALDSGAAEAMARAFARTGGAQVGDARNSAAAQGRVLDTDQSNLARNMKSGMSNLSNYGRNTVNDARTTWGQNLDTLRGTGDAEGIGHLVDVSADDVWADEATRWLMEADAGLAGRMGGIQAWGQDQIDKTAYEWDMAGREGVNPFAAVEFGQGYQTSGDGGYGGAPISQIPLYTRRDDGSAPAPVGAPAYLRDERLV